MMTSGERYKYGIDEWEAEFSRIYKHVDIRRSPPEMWLHLVEDATTVAECLRKDKYEKALRPLAHVFGWACSFVWRCRFESVLGCQIQKPLSRIVWDKYPAHCSLCGQERCICSVRRHELEELSKEEKEKKLEEIEGALSVARHRTENMPKTLDEFTDMFRRIYKGAHYDLSVGAIAFHFMEEIGEVSTCIRLLMGNAPTAPASEVAKLQNELERELADIVSWAMSLVSKLDYILGAGVAYSRRLKPAVGVEDEAQSQTAGIRLSHIVWDAFQTPDGNTLYCPTCKARPCECTVTPFGELG
ncbi:MAG: hypothetical protein DDT33_01287 [Firmicutes bacterium]|nr:hypothetical protein [Bacillota bacterium]